MTDAREILSASALYSGLAPEDLERLSDRAEIVHTPKGGAIFRAGSTIPGVYAIGRGAVRLLRTGPSGKVHVVRFVEEGQSFGEAAAIGAFPTPVGAVAAEDTVCAMLPQPLFVELLRSDHALCLAIMRSMAARTQHLVDLLEDLVLRDAVGRVAKLLLRHEPEAERWFELIALKRELAQHLNLTGETFSRTLRRLRDANLVECREERLRILDLEGLRGLAEGQPLPREPEDEEED